MSMTPEMLEILRAEILGDPAARGYAGRNSADVADLLNAQYAEETKAAGTRDVPISEVAVFLASRLLTGKWRRFVATPPPGVPEDLVDGLGELLQMLDSDKVPTIEMSNPEISAQVGKVLGGAAQYGLLSPEAAAHLLALGDEPARYEIRHARVMEIFLGIEGAPNAVSETDVVEARA